MSIDLWITSPDRSKTFYSCQCVAGNCPTDRELSVCAQCRECKGTGVIVIERDAYSVNMSNSNFRLVMSVIGIHIPQDDDCGVIQLIDLAGACNDWLANYYQRRQISATIMDDGYISERVEQIIDQIVLPGIHFKQTTAAYG
jgi:hypothetical protein